APAISERLKRLEEAGAIEGYQAVINPSAIGLTLSAWLRIRPVPGELSRVTELLKTCPEIVQCDRVTGEDCFMAKAHFADIGELEALIDRINPYAMTNTAVIQSSPVAGRVPDLSNLLSG
ncbi:MAG: Lrp/AsnC family transcriptional regulator, partial [Sneathiellales bacterium]|nr:Lrp/AsnC family transcriptional regulator [Sneathiellales bacterium]